MYKGIIIIRTILYDNLIVFFYYILQGGDKIVLNLSNYSQDFSNNDVRSLPDSCLTNQVAETINELQKNPFENESETENIKVDIQSNNPFICNESSAIEKIVDISSNVGLKMIYYFLIDYLFDLILNQTASNNFFKFLNKFAELLCVYFIVLKYELFLSDMYLYLLNYFYFLVNKYL